MFLSKTNVIFNIFDNKINLERLPSVVLKRSERSIILSSIKSKLIE